MNKPFVVFTNFWDVDELISKNILILQVNDNNYCIDFSDTNKYEINSIALSHPPIKCFKSINKISRLDFFCPSYDMLMNYKEDNDFEKYTKNYLDLIKTRKNEIKKWLNALNKDKIYFMCCWENTSFGKDCHRKILFDLFSHYNSVKDKAIYIYRNGIYQWMSK
jgi:hypothetical protein